MPALTAIALALACAAPPRPAAERAAYYDLVAPAGPAEQGGAGDTDPERGLLYLPAGARREYLLFLEPGTTLRVERLSLRGARLRVEVETDAGGAVVAGSYSRSAADVVLALRSPERVPARLVLASAGDPGGAVVLGRPALWAPAAPPAGPRPVAAAAARRPSILVYLIDTLRPDRLGCYGYARPVSPGIDSFAARSTLFADAVAQSSWTKPAVASIFTGVWPPAHGALGWKHRLPESFETLAESLRAGGYRTAAFVTNPNVTAEFGFGQGFDDFAKILKVPSDEVNDRVLRWLDGRSGGEPFFLYVHTMDPHAPYTPPEPWRSRFAPTADRMPSWEPSWRWPDAALPYLSELYDAEIAQNDASFGELLAALERRGLYDDLVIVLVSDHGEEFREHGKWRHGNHLHRETLSVPLLVKLPGQRQGRRVREPVQQLDLFPTLRELAGLEAGPGLEGRSLVALAAGEAGAPPVPVRSHLRLGRSPEQVSLVDGEWKLIATLAGEGFSPALYDLRADPGETRDLASDLPVRAAVYTAALAAAWKAASAAPAAPEAPVDPELERTLRALGYLQ